MEDDLRRLLDELHTAIERTREGDGDGDQEELTRLVDAVERHLHAGDATSEARREHHGHLMDSLRQAGIRFEQDHPVLGEAIRRAINALSAAGI